MKRLSVSLLGLLALFGLPLNSFALDSSELLGAAQSIDQNFQSGDEASGVVYHPRLDSLFVVLDEGYVVKMDTNGENLSSFFIGGDLEGITYKKAIDETLLVADEYSGSIRELSWDSDANSLSETGRAWEIDEALVSEGLISSYSRSSGLEALSSDGNLFYVGYQATGEIFVVRLNADESVDYIRTIVSLHDDIAGLDYDRDTATLYALYDGAQSVVSMNAKGDIWAEYSVPNRNQEGFALAGDEIVIVQDHGADNFPELTSYTKQLSSAGVDLYADNLAWDGNTLTWTLGNSGSVDVEANRNLIAKLQIKDLNTGSYQFLFKLNSEDFTEALGAGGSQTFSYELDTSSLDLSHNYRVILTIDPRLSLQEDNKRWSSNTDFVDL